MLVRSSTPDLSGKGSAGVNQGALQAPKKFAVFDDGGKEDAMPGGDRTGPLGLGPGTGWGRGFCTGFGAPGFSYGGRGRGFGRGFGFRRFWGAPTVSPVDETSVLKSQINAMEDALNAARKYLSEIETEKK